MSRKKESKIPLLHHRIDRLRRQMMETNYVCAGTLQKRMKTCGRANCRCAQDPEARHGPYHEWTHREKGRLVNTRLSEEQALLMAKAIANYRAILKLFAQWSDKSAKVILAKKKDYSN